MKNILNVIAKLQNAIARLQMRRAAFVLRADYNDPAMQEFGALDGDDFLGN